MRSAPLCMHLLFALSLSGTVCSSTVAGSSLQEKANQEKAQKGQTEGDQGEKKGTLIGKVVSKGKNYIEVLAFGEARPRKYVPHWRGGLPKDGGGLDKKMLAQFDKLKVGMTIRLTWEFEERPRAVMIEILDEKKDDKK